MDFGGHKVLLEKDFPRSGNPKLSLAINLQLLYNTLVAYIIY